MKAACLVLLAFVALCQAYPYRYGRPFGIGGIYSGGLGMRYGSSYGSLGGFPYGGSFSMHRRYPSYRSFYNGGSYMYPGLYRGGYGRMYNSDIYDNYDRFDRYDRYDRGSYGYGYSNDRFENFY